MSGALCEAARRELATPAPVGQRHAQIVRLVALLRAGGFSPSEIFFRLRANYDAASLPDTEISAVIGWAERKIPQAEIAKNGGQRDFSPNFSARISTHSPIGKRGFGSTKMAARDYFQIAGEFLQGFSIGEPDLFDASPIKLPGNFRRDAELAFESLYSPTEKLNIVTRFRGAGTEGTNGKTSPLGCGETLSRNEWIDSFRNKSIPESEAGAWFRINPVNGNGISDRDVSEFRFALLESDFLPLETQISLLVKLPIPICAILNSGGRSVHAWVRIAATNAGEYRESVSEMFSLLASYGFDPANKNPSRLSRLPGAQRLIGANGDGKQRLLYLNPNPPNQRSIA